MVIPIVDSEDISNLRVSCGASAQMGASAELWGLSPVVSGVDLYLRESIMCHIASIGFDCDPM